MNIHRENTSYCVQEIIKNRDLESLESVRGKHHDLVYIGTSIYQPGSILPKLSAKHTLGSSKRLILSKFTGMSYIITYTPV